VVVSNGQQNWKRERRKRNIALALLLCAFAVLIYFLSLVQWHGGQ
jgi:hypothetical protein